MIEKIYKEEVEIEIIDNKAKDTLLCIHGLYSDKDFIGGLPKIVNTFNIVTFSYGKLKDLSYQNILKITNYILHEKIKNSRVHILAHSLGGLIASEVGKAKKVKSINFINTIHPNIFMYKAFIALVTFVTGQNSKGVRGKIFKATSPKMKKLLPENLYKFIDAKSNWYNIISSTLIDKNVIEKQMAVNLLEVKHKSNFLVSKVDKIISNVDLTKYLESIKKDYTVINSSRHSPLHNKSSNKEIAYALGYIKYKKRIWFKKKIIKK